MNGGNEGEATLRVQDGLHVVAHVVEERDEHDESKTTVDQCRRNHAPGDNEGGVLDLLSWWAVSSCTSRQKQNHLPM